MHGQRVCKMHGGMTPGAREKAEERQLVAAAEKALKDQDLWPGLDKVTPVKDPVAALAKLAGSLDHMTSVVGARVNELGSVAGGEHLTQLRAEVALLERLIARSDSLLTNMARLNLGARQVELAQGQAQLVISAAQAGLEALAAVLDLPAEAREVFLQALVGRLRAGRADVVVAGEVAS